MEKENLNLTKFEVARIIGARALQISMDAPLLLNISTEDLEIMGYDALKIAEREFTTGVLPISVKRPMPIKTGGKLQPVREDSVDDEKIVEKEKEVEAEIAEKAEEIGLVNENDIEDNVVDETSSNEE